MIIRLARHSGYCFGVKRAINIALDAIKAGKQVYTIGPLIHNPQIVKKLEEQGIKVAYESGHLVDSTVIIRSHGIGKTELGQLKHNGNQVIDATCPYVSRTHEIVSTLVEESYPVFIFGDSDHPEVVAMQSYGDAHTRVLGQDWQADGVRRIKLGVLSQTTKRIADFERFVAALLPQTTELRIFNTICCATSQRQNATLALAACSDLMVVVGGKNSSNTKMLADICRATTETVFVETAAELSVAAILGFSQIGICAGASTPDDAIVEVYNKIKEIYGELPTAQTLMDIPIFKEESC